MHHFLDRFRSCLNDDLAGIHLWIAWQMVLYFAAGRGLYALAAGMRRIPANAKSRYTAVYIMVGAMAWHGVAFVVLLAGLQSILWAHAVAFVPFAAFIIWRPRHAIAFHKAWALLLLVLLVLVFVPVGTNLYHAMAQSWDEFTHWSSRAKQLYVLDRLPNENDPIPCVAPQYGLYATLISALTYVSLGRENVGAGTAWSLLFAIFVVIHMYEYLRAHDVSMLLAGPFCTWFLASLSTDQQVPLTLTMYADIFVLAGGAIVCLHAAEIALDRNEGRDLTEDLVLLAGGLGILLFTKNTADISAVCAVGYFGLLLILRAIVQREWRAPLRSAGLLLLTLIPALLIRGLWWWYYSRTYADDARILVEQGPPPGSGDLWAPDPQSPLLIAQHMLKGLIEQQPYFLVLVAFPGCWIADALLRLGARRNDETEKVSAQGLFLPLMLTAFVAVFHINYGPFAAERAYINTARYAAAGLIPGACYVVAVVQRFLTWSFNQRFSSVALSPA